MNLLSDLTNIIHTLVQKYGEDEFNWFFPKNAIAFEKQLQKELLNKKHLLQSKKLQCFIKNGRNDDVIFITDNEVYLVHLTWNTNTDDNYPFFYPIKVNQFEHFLEQDYLEN